MTTQQALDRLRALCRGRPELQREAERGVAHVEEQRFADGGAEGGERVSYVVTGDTGLLFDAFASRAPAEGLAAVIRRHGPAQTWGAS